MTTAAGALVPHGPASRVAASDVEALRAALRGTLVTPDEPGYDAARRVWNGAID